MLVPQVFVQHGPFVHGVALVHGSSGGSDGIMGTPHEGGSPAQLGTTGMLGTTPDGYTTAAGRDMPSPCSGGGRVREQRCGRVVPAAMCFIL